tara:strand:+ start:3434 stop:4195 length:762 start_codon:yes stop_codon:yes gene_type:complete
MLKSLKKQKQKIRWSTLGVFDRNIGFYKYKFDQYFIYIRHPQHFKKKSKIIECCEEIIYHYYKPKNTDTVVDFGTGYGEEGVYIHKHSPNVRYIGIEPQPSVYECLANTFNKISDNFIAVPFAISNENKIQLSSNFMYLEVNSNGKPYIEIPTLSWDSFCKRYKIDQIDLLKMNIEGSEKWVLKEIQDFTPIKRLIVSCHDFRANRGDGEIFRTKKEVVSILNENRYKIKTFDHMTADWQKDWIYAEREHHKF